MALTSEQRQQVTAQDQSDGVQTFTMEQFYGRHQLQFEPSAAPSAGTMTFSARTPGATAYQDLDFTMDLTDATQYTYQIRGYFDSLKATPALYDAAKTYALTVFSSRV